MPGAKHTEYFHDEVGLFINWKSQHPSLDQLWAKYTAYTISSVTATPQVGILIPSPHLTKPKRDNWPKVRQVKGIQSLGCCAHLSPCPTTSSGAMSAHMLSCPCCLGHSLMQHEAMLAEQANAGGLLSGSSSLSHCDQFLLTSSGLACQEKKKNNDNSKHFCDTYCAQYYSKHIARFTYLILTTWEIGIFPPNCIDGKMKLRKIE